MVRIFTVARMFLHLYKTNYKSYINVTYNFKDLFTLNVVHK